MGSLTGTALLAASVAPAVSPTVSPTAVAPSPPIAAPSIDLIGVLPVLIVLGAACLAVIVEAALPKRQRFVTQVVLAVAAIIAAGVVTVVLGVRGHYVVTFAGAIAVDSATYVMWGSLLALALVAVPVMADRVIEPGGVFAAEASAVIGSPRAKQATAVATPMQTEVFPLALFAVGGMLVFPAASDLLTLFVALEVMSLPLYLLSGMARRKRLISQEAAVKYFLIGAFTSAILLYGIALLYGYAGSVKFAAIASAAKAGGGSDLLLLAGIGLLVVGLLYKGSVGPFHLWTPDVYQGAPTPHSAFMGACTKFAAFAALLRVMQVALGGMAWSWKPVLMVIAVISMAIGAFFGVIQQDLKRMLAYSSVAHAGFLLLGVMSITERGVTATLFYLLTYGFATIGGFNLLMLVRRGGLEAPRLADWAGIGKKSPAVAATMTIFLLSLAGIPLTSGFIGKVVIFTAAMNAGMGPLVVIAMIATVVTAFFYLRVIVMMYFAEPPAKSVGGIDAPTVALPSTLTLVSIAVCAILTILLGIVPQPVLDIMHVTFPLLS
ncbi:MAG: NADH-quinone oxidoreductase subunit NuoN [Actinobacteria bacterium]|nr:NADH-quinone oxidoreductase subunit NuoN [Actinomycetota bacterium]